MNRDNSYLIGNKFAIGNKPNSTSFRKSHKTWNKGMRGVHFSARTEFKMGIKSLKWIAVGTITIRCDKGSGTPRQWIKFKDDFLAGIKNWMQYANWLWIKNRGPISKGLCVHHVNNDSMDDRVENLTLVTRQEHPTLHNRYNTKNRKMSERRIHNEAGLMAGMV